jgi:hypothetical protein
VLRKKKRSYRAKKATLVSLATHRKKTKVVTFSEDKIAVAQAEDGIADLDHLKMLLLQFCFDSVVNGGGDGKEEKEI